jgi:hypothetical protein
MPTQVGIHAFSRRREAQPQWCDARLLTVNFFDRHMQLKQPPFAHLASAGMPA